MPDHTNGVYATTSGTGDTIWTAWNSGTCTTAGVTISADPWIHWTSSTVLTTCGTVRVPARYESDEARAAREEAERREYLEEEKQRTLARKRARVLLLTHLTVEQRRAMKKTGAFRVVARGSGNTYIIDTRHGQARNVKKLNADGRVVCTLCAHPQDVLVPDEDAYLAQKFMLEHAEEEFLRVANVS